jgi:hemoglobin
MRTVQPKPRSEDSLDLDGVALSFHDVSTVIDTFYGRVAVDDLLKIPFGSVQDWPHHVERLIHFWWIRLGGSPYMAGMYNPVEKHFQAGFNAKLLERWLGLLKSTLDEKLKPDQSFLWFEIAEQMGVGLSMRNEHLIEAHKTRVR